MTGFPFLIRPRLRYRSRDSRETIPGAFVGETLVSSNQEGAAGLHRSDTVPSTRDRSRLCPVLLNG